MEKHARTRRLNPAAAPNKVNRVKVPANVRFKGLTASTLPAGFQDNVKTALENILNPNGGNDVVVTGPNGEADLVVMDTPSATVACGDKVI